MSSADVSVDRTLEGARVRRLWGYVAGLAVIALVCLLFGHVYVSGDGLMSAAFGASAIVHFSARPSKRAAIMTMLLAAALIVTAGSALDLGGIQPVFDRVVSALGLASLVVRIVGLVRAPPRHWTSEQSGYAALTLLSPMFSLAFASSIGLPGALRSGVLDSFVLAFDQRMFWGHSPSVIFGQYVAKHPWLAVAAAFCYWAPPPLAVVVYLAERRRFSDDDVITALLIAGGVGFVFFPFFPVVGPGYVLPHFPYPTSLIASTVPIPASVPRNCMPSLHMANALIVAFYTWRLKERSWRGVGIANVVLTVVATLGFGSHYAADLIAAVPFTYGALGAARRKAGAAALGWGLTVACLVLVRYGA